MDNNSLLLLVEGQTDKQIVSWLLKAAKIPLNKINIKPLDGKKNIINLVANLPKQIASNCAILVDIDSKIFPMLLPK